MAKKNKHAKQGFGVNDPQDAIHMGQGKRIRLEDVPADGTTGDKQVGNRAYNDARYQAKSGAAKTTRWLTPLIVQWSGTGLVYNHSQATFEIEGEEGIFTVQAGQKTLAVANPDNGRFDRFAANTDGQVIVIQGTPSPDPAEPSLPSPDTQIAGPVVFVGAGATEPSTGTGPTQIQNVTIYNENVAPEWANTYGGPGTADFNNTLNPFTGTRSINVSNVQNNSVLTFIAPADFNVADYDSIGMQLRLKELMLSGYNIRARFLNNAGVAVSNQVTLAINKNLFGAYQFIGIPMDQFTFTASTARRLELRWARGSGSVTYVGFFLDALVMQGGIIPSVVNGDVILQGQVQGSGKTGTPINVTVTEKFISDQTAQTDPLPGTAQTTFRLADGSLRKVSASMLVAAGVAGDDGWSPVFGLVTDGERRVLQLVDWVGGEGTKPSTGQYIGPTGLVATAAEAVDLRGSQGATGAPGTNGTNGTDGTDGREVELRVSGTNLQWRYVGDVSWITLIDLSTIGGSGVPPGGTTGQVLTKNSNTDGDASWKHRPIRVFNVEDYGAVHNGITDDTDAIQSAINAAFNAGGGRVYFPSGIYIIGGALQTNVGGINYNSQIYIPQSGLTSTRTTIELVGEFQPNLIQSIGLPAAAISPNTGAVLRSTIQGSGTEPSVICNRGSSSNFQSISYTCLQVKNISIQLTPNGSNKITMGGINCHDSAIANFEYVACYPFNLDLSNSAIPDVINVTGISMPKEATEHINTVRNCTVGGFTNGYRIGEHTSLYDAIAICCINGFLVTENNHLPYMAKVSAFWCINSITINSSAPTAPGGYYFLCSYLAVEWRVAASWYDNVNILNDPSNHGFGELGFDIVEANVGVNNEKFKKNGGANIICKPITKNISGQITDLSYTLKYNDGFRKNKANNSSNQTIQIPPASSVSFDIDQEIVIQRLGTGEVEITAGSGVTLNVPTGFLAKIKSRYDAVSLVQTAINNWVIYGALTPA